jgi:phytoene dehydrogenase-like protein
VPGAWLIGAASWPGPGVSGASGYALAGALIDATADTQAAQEALA